MNGSICRQCGRAARAEAQYCAGCGARLRPGSESLSSPPSRNSRVRRRGLIVAVLILTAFGLIAILQRAGLPRDRRGFHSAHVAGHTHHARRFRNDFGDHETADDEAIESIRITEFESEGPPAEADAPNPERGLRFRQNEIGAHSRDFELFRGSNTRMVDGQSAPYNGETAVHRAE